MSRKTAYALVSLIIFTAGNLIAQSTVSFLSTDLNDRSELLFAAEVQQGDKTWQNLYKTKIVQDERSAQASSGEVQLLNCYPQKLDALQGGDFLQVRNSDGIFMYSVNEKKIQQLSLNSILNPTLLNYARVHDNIIETIVSPDGNWMCYLKKVSPTNAILMLSNTQTGQDYILNNEASFSFKDIPVLWSEDSSTILYEKKDSVYFLPVRDVEEASTIEEKYRKVGNGTINSIAWASSENILYIEDEIVYSISINELYTRALYSDLLGSGKVVGRLPWKFESKKDRFWVDESGTQLVLMQDKHSLFYFELIDPYTLNAKESQFVKTLYSQAFVPILDAAVDFDVFWIPNPNSSTSRADIRNLKIPLLWLSYSTNINDSSVYYLNTTESFGTVRFDKLDIPNSAQNPSLSLDKKTLAFTAQKNRENPNQSLYLYDVSTWNLVGHFDDEDVITYEWKNNSSLFVGGEQTTRIWDFSNKKMEFLFLSSINQFAWDVMGDNVLVKNDSGTYEFVENTLTWQPTEKELQEDVKNMNDQWRIMSSDKHDGPYENVLFVRSLQGKSETKPLFSSFLVETTEQPKVSFVFDALNNRDGLVSILDVLSNYGLTGSFFINGEFFKRFPDIILTIVDRGHEIAPMFNAVVDLATENYVLDKTYIRRGLANIEDEFFALTGKDMELFWHAPYYRSSAVIEEAGNESGYILVKDVLNVEDTVTLEMAAKENITYKSSSQIIESLIGQLHDGAIIPISVGVSNGSRNDYVYENMDILINAIYEAGYAIAPVSSLLY